MSFTSTHATTIPHAFPKTWEILTSKVNFAAFMQYGAKPSDVTLTDPDELVTVAWPADFNPSTADCETLANNLPTVQSVSEASSAAASGEFTPISAKRTHFLLYEAVPLIASALGSTIAVQGTQVDIEALGLVICEYTVGAGTVRMLKARRLASDENGGTRVDEHMLGRTNWVLRAFMQRTLRRTHVAHVDAYASLVEEALKDDEE